DFTFRVRGVDYAVPGFMLWAAIAYALVGSLLSYFVGRNLIGRNADRYAREADLRFALVRISEHVDSIALAAGEAPARSRPHEPHVDHRRIRLDLGHGADPDLGAAVLQRQDLVRRHDAGGQRVHSGAGIAAVVRR